MSTRPVIVVERVSFAYNSVKALQDVNLTINEREFVWVVGPNGGGKTTLIKLLIGLLTPSQGRIQVLGLPPHQARQRIGYMPQHTHLDPRFPMIVMDVVLMGRLGLRAFGPYRRRDKAAAERVLRETGLWELRRQPYATLSGGQQRRVQIARALAGDPELLLLDEPTANLDMTAEEGLFDLLQALSERLTIVMASHDPAFVSQFVKRVICVNRTVAIHPTAALQEGIMTELYGRPVRLVRHDRHQNSGENHERLP